MPISLMRDCTLVDAGGAMTALNDLCDVGGAGFDFLRARHAEEDFFERVAAGEVASYFVGNEERVLADFGLAVGVCVFYEDADDGERYAVDGDGAAYGLGVAAVEFDGHGADDVGDLGVGDGVLIVEETAGFYLEVANLLVLRADAEEHGVFGDAAADGDAVVELQHGRAGGDAGNLGIDGLHVFEGHEVRRADVVWPHDDAAGVLHLDFVRAEAGDGVERVLATGKTDGGYENDGRRTDDHAEHGEEKTCLAGGEAFHGQPEGFAEGNGGTGAAQGASEGFVRTAEKLGLAYRLGWGGSRVGEAGGHKSSTEGCVPSSIAGGGA